VGAHVQHKDRKPQVLTVKKTQSGLVLTFKTPRLTENTFIKIIYTFAQLKHSREKQTILIFNNVMGVQGDPF